MVSRSEGSRWSSKNNPHSAANRFPALKLLPGAVSALLFLAADLPAATQGTDPVKGATLLTESSRTAAGPSRRTASLAAGPQLLPRNVARGLVKAWRKTEPKPPDATLRANTVRSRGEALTRLYQQCAPAVVMILGKDGGSFGSGFLISEDGWLLTNHHMAADASMSDSLTYEMTVILGALSGEGYMEPLKTTFSAEVYKWDQVRDLALLKLRDFPVAASNAFRPGVIKVATKSPAVGDDVAAIGHAGVTLLWSIKPGYVQAVGRNPFDTPGLLALWEQRRQAEPDKALAASLDELKAEVEKEVGSAGKVFHVQASCPIMAGDSGGPLLNLSGEAVGISAFSKTDRKTGGNAYYFVHQREIVDFLKDKPAAPLLALPAFWDVEADTCKVSDADADGRFETLECRSLVIDPDVLVSFNLQLKVAAWDLKGATDFRNYMSKAASEADPKPDIDATRLYGDKAMRFQVYAIFYDNSTVVCYDLNDDGFFERVREGKPGDGLCAREFLAEGKDKPHKARAIRETENLFLPAKELPEAWRTTYEKAVLAKMEKPGK